MNSQDIEEKLIEGGSAATKRAKDSKEMLFRALDLANLASKSSPIEYDPKKMEKVQTADMLVKVAFNLKQKNGSVYKDKSWKQNFYNICHLVQREVFEHQKVHLDYKDDPTFRPVKDAKQVVRKEIQEDPTKHEENAAPLTIDEFIKICNLFTDDNPDGLNRLNFFLLQVLFMERGGAGSRYKLHHFKFEKDNTGERTGRLLYNPIFTKKTQVTEKEREEKEKMLAVWNDPDQCPWFVDSQEESLEE